MRLLVTGASGFVGGYLCRELANAGHDVVRLARHGDVEYPVDVTDADALVRAVRDCSPSGIFHLAAVAYVPDAENDTARALSVNVDGTRFVLEAARTVDARVIFVSSGAVYGDRTTAGPPFREEDPLAPRGIYAQSKARAEQLCVDRRAFQSIVRLRAFNHTGPGQESTYVCSGFARQVAEVSLGLRDPVIHVGDLSAERDLCDVRDIVRAYAQSLVLGRPGEVYNVCSGVPTRIQDVLLALMEIAGIEAEVRVESARLRAGGASCSWGDRSKASTELGWSPEKSLRTTISDLLTWWRDHLGSNDGVHRVTSTKDPSGP